MYAADYREFLTLQDAKYKGTIPVEKRRDCKFQVEFENVSFKYPGSEQYVIKNLNLKFVIGKKMAIVGKNGSGKSTCLLLFFRIFLSLIFQWVRILQQLPYMIKKESRKQ